jgi:hypothetical protein
MATSKRYINWCDLQSVIGYARQFNGSFAVVRKHARYELLHISHVSKGDTVAWHPAR